MPTRKSLLPAAGIILATILAYWPALHGALLWDDAAHVTRPGLRGIQGLWRIWTVPGATQQYYPLLHSAFWLEHAVWGDSVFWYHLLNVLLHGVAALLVVRLVRRLELPGAWLTGLLFALHPMCVESVAWISEQKSTLSGVFFLAAALSYLRFEKSRARAAYSAALLFFVAALLSKTVTAVLPGVLLVALWWRRGKVEWKPLVPFFALGAGAGIMTVWVERTLIGAQGAEFLLSPAQRILLAGRAAWFYASKVVWPADLAFFYPRWTLNPGDFLQWLFPAAALAALAILWRWRGAFAAAVIFVGTLFPALGFFNVFPFRYSFVADHFAYLAILAILIPLAAASRRFGIWPGAIAAAALFVLTFQQAGHYRDEETLYRATLVNSPNAWLAHNNLGNLLLERPAAHAEALAHIQEALRLAPDAMETHLSMGNVLLQTPGRLNDAIAEYQTAVRLAPNSERAHTNLGNAFVQAGRVSEAVPQLEQALRIDATDAEAHNDLGNAFMQMPGRLTDAIEQYRAAIAAEPDFAEAHNNLGRALAALPGKLPDAIAEFEASIRAKPDYATAHSNLGNALSMIGRRDDAIAEYRIAVRLRPDSAAAHNNLGYALSQTPATLPEAIAECREAVRLQPDSADYHFNLGMALAQTPAHRAEAISELETVLRLKPNARVREIVDRLHAL